MVAVRVRLLVDASLSAMLVERWVSSPRIEESSVLSTEHTTIEALLMLKATPQLVKNSIQPYSASTIHFLEAVTTDLMFTTLHTNFEQQYFNMVLVTAR